MSWPIVRRLVLMALIMATAAVTQNRFMLFGYGAMFGVLGLMLLDKWTERAAAERAASMQAEQFTAIMSEMRKTFTAQHEAIESARTERDHYRRLYLKKVNGE